MDFRFTSDQLELAAALRAMLEREFTAADLRRVWDSGTGHDTRTWNRLAEMGVFGVLVPESDRGLGGTMTDAVLLLEELGRAGVPGPVIETIAVGGTALAGTELGKQIASGELTVTAALRGETLIPHRGSAEVVLARDGRPVLASVEALALTPVEGLDGGRLLGQLGAPGTAGAVPLDADLAHLCDVGTLAVAAGLLGLASRMIDMAAAYARERRQFGQPIGAFQAVKHLMANALLRVEFARALPCMPQRGRSRPSRELVGVMCRWRSVSHRRPRTRPARAALQVHGAIGYTWECDLHLYMKKAWALIPAWGGPAEHRRVVGDSVLGSRGG